MKCAAETVTNTNKHAYGPHVSQNMAGIAMRNLRRFANLRASEISKGKLSTSETGNDDEGVVVRDGRALF